MAFIKIAALVKGDKRKKNKIYNDIYRHVLKEGTDYVAEIESRTVYKVRDDLEV